MTRLKCLALACVTIVLLAGCTSGDAPRESVADLLEDAIVSERTEPDALAACKQRGTTAQWVAAFMSTVAEVRPALAAPVGKTEPDSTGIPDDPESPMLVCVSTTTDPEGERWYFAGWLSEDTGYTGMIAVFPERDLGLS